VIGKIEGEKAAVVGDVIAWLRDSDPSPESKIVESRIAVCVTGQA